MLGPVSDEDALLDRIETLVAEEHRLWREEGGQDAHERLAAVRAELGGAYAELRRLRAGQRGPALRDADVPDPDNDLDGPDPEPPHAEHGVHSADSSRDDPAPNAP